MLCITKKKSKYLIYNFRNYAQALKCYIQAMKNDINNFNVIRDLSYLQLYLRQFNSFLDSARKCVNIRPNMIINWTTYAFAQYLAGNFESAYKLMDTCEKIGTTSLNDQNKNEMVFFQNHMLIKQNKYEEALTFLKNNENNVLDKFTFIEKMVEVASKINRKEEVIEYVNKGLKINSENMNLILAYIKFNHSKYENIVLNNFQDLINYANTDNQISEEFLKIIQEDLKPRLKSRVINRLELCASSGEKFREIFNSYFLANVKSDLPSIFTNVKFIYTDQKQKISIIEEVLMSHVKSVSANKRLDEGLTKGEILDNPAYIAWVNYYAAQHFDHLRNLESALSHINLAINSTPSVVEFYMIKSKIVKHSGDLTNSAAVYEKAKKLDLGDRFLNAKYAKIFVRKGDISKSVEIMKEFVRDPLTDENLDHFQCMWYETECGLAYLNHKNILRSHRLFKFILSHFSSLIEDQFDFYNYCLRRFMINDFVQTIEFMDKLLDNKYVYKSLENLEIILQFLKKNEYDLEENVYYFY